MTDETTGTFSDFCPGAAQAELDVKRMVEACERALAATAERRERALAAFSEASSLGEAICEALVAGDAALVVGSPAAFEMRRFSPDSTRLILRLIDDGLLELLECSHLDGEWLIIIRRPKDWAVYELASPR